MWGEVKTGVTTWSCCPQFPPKRTTYWSSALVQLGPINVLIFSWKLVQKWWMLHYITYKSKILIHWTISLQTTAQIKIVQCHLFHYFKQHTWNYNLPLLYLGGSRNSSRCVCKRCKWENVLFCVWFGFTDPSEIFCFVPSLTLLACMRLCRCSHVFVPCTVQFISQFLFTYFLFCETVIDVKSALVLLVC